LVASMASKRGRWMQAIAIGVLVVVMGLYALCAICVCAEAAARRACCSAACAELTPDEKLEYERNYRTFTRYLDDNRIWLNSPIAFQRFIMRSSRDPQARQALLARNRALSIAFNSEAKLDRLEEILRSNPDERILIFTQHNDLAYKISRRFLLPFVTHNTGKEERFDVLKDFREGTYRAIVTSKVLDEGIDVPEASIGVIVSGTGSSREFVQRLGRLLRKSEGKGQARLIELVSRETSETRTSSRRTKNMSQKRRDVI